MFWPVYLIAYVWGMFHGYLFSLFAAYTHINTYKQIDQQTVWKNTSLRRVLKIHQNKWWSLHNGLGSLQFHNSIFVFFCYVLCINVFVVTVSIFQFDPPSIIYPLLKYERLCLFTQELIWPTTWSLTIQFILIINCVFLMTHNYIFSIFPNT